MNRLIELYQNFGQSPWIDNLSRSWLNSGRIIDLKDQGIRGLTSNPTIFANAISKSDDYDKNYFELAKEMDVKSAYWEMASKDVSDAADVLSEIYEDSNGTDGFVSIEVDPDLAHDTAGTIEAAQWLWDKIDRKNLMVKIPATKEGIPAITESIARGISVNVTLIFGLDRYKDVMDAHIDGLFKAVEAGIDISHISSVASFFVSRVDTKLDPILEQMSDEAQKLMGKSAVAQAQAAYIQHTDRYSQKDWSQLSESGAQVQRPLWASTSTKNPKYSDLLYVENLVAPGTVNTMPENTVLAYLDHGKPLCNVEHFETESSQILNSLNNIGIDLVKISDELEKEGVSSFSKSFEDLIAALESKKSAM